MRIDSPAAYARQCRTSRSAAIAAVAIETEISLGERPQDWYDEAEDALAYLRDEHPGFWKLDAYMAPPTMSRTARETLDPKPEPPKHAPPGRAPKALKLRAGGTLIAVWVTLLLVGGIVLLVGSGHSSVAATPVAALSPAWATFQDDCTSGPATGQGSAPSACECWERNLQAQAILPDYAVGALNAAQVGGGQAYTVRQNLAGQPVGWAMRGCALAG